MLPVKVLLVFDGLDVVIVEGRLDRVRRRQRVLGGTSLEEALLSELQDTPCSLRHRHSSAPNTKQSRRDGQHRN